MNAKLNSISMANQFDIWFQPHEKLGGKSMMDHLYNRLDGAYPNKWRSNFPGPDAIDNWKCSWAEAFEEEGITPNDIKAGLKACRSKYDWPPSCAEFIKACKPSVDPLVAYYEALAGIQARAKGEMGQWSHPAIYWAATQMSFDLNHQTYSQIKPRWERALSEQMDRGEWDEIKMPLVALPDASRLSREEAAKRLEEIGAARVTKDAESRTDHLRWAKIAIEDLKHGGKRFPAITYKLAKEALEA